MNVVKSDQPSYPFFDTAAQQMLDTGLKQTQLETGLNQHQIAKERLGYKTSVVLSHMARGRVPIPVDRAKDLAAALNLDSGAFQLAVLEQRFPHLDFRNLFNPTFSSDRTVARLEAIAGCSLDALPEATIQVLQEVVAARSPRRRWLAPAELATMEFVRGLRPESPQSGLSDQERQAITEAFLGS